MVIYKHLQTRSSKMLINFVLLVALPVAWGYTIKVQGKVELGEDLARVLNEFREKFLQEGNLEEILGLVGGKAKDSHHHQDLSSKEKNKAMYSLVEQKDGYGDDVRTHKIEKKDLSVLDEIVIKNENRAHVYGKHSKVKRPHNNIHA